MDIDIMIPCFNEEKNLIVLLPALKKILEEKNIVYQITVIDAFSSDDNTRELCETHECSYIKQPKDGYGDAFRLAIKHSEKELLLIVDGDMSQDIEKIPAMYDEILKGADISIGSRYVKGGVTHDPLTSVIMSKILNNVYRIMLGFREKDISTDFRIYKTALLKELKLECMNFDVIEETLFFIKIRNPEIIIREIPINYKRRLEGTSKRRLIAFIIGYIKLLFRLLTYRKRGETE